MNNYTIITKGRVNETESEALYEEQTAVLKENGHDWNDGICAHYFDSPWFYESKIHDTIDEAIQGLAIKDGVDLVRFDNGNLGFVAYYNGGKNAFEILEEE